MVRHRDTYRDREGRDHAERRVRPAMSLTLWDRHYPITLKNIVVVFGFVAAVGSAVGWFFNRFVFPWPTRSEVATSIEEVGDAVEVIRIEHDKTRDQIVELKTSAELTAQAVCAMARRFAPENAPPGCVPITRPMNGVRR